MKRIWGRLIEAALSMILNQNNISAFRKFFVVCYSFETVDLQNYCRYHWQSASFVEKLCGRNYLVTLLIIRGSLLFITSRIKWMSLEICHSSKRVIPSHRIEAWIWQLRWYLEKKSEIEDVFFERQYIFPGSNRSWGAQTFLQLWAVTVACF